MFGTLFLAVLRGLVVFYTIPVLLLLLLLHLIERSLIRNDGAVLSLAIGPVLVVLGFAISGFIGELLGPVGICWLVTALLGWMPRVLRMVAR